MEYTIVGGGIAAYAALKAIRDLDRESRVTVVSEEEHCFYYRPMTPLVVKGDKERDEILQAGEMPGFQAIHDRAIGLDPAAGTIALAQGAPVGFQRLLIATGSSPVIPVVKGLTRDNVYLLRTLADAERLRQAAKTSRSAVVIGAGLVGIKKAVALHRSGLAVTVIEQQEEILLPRLDREGAAMVAAKLRGEGITILTGEGVAEMDGQGGALTLASGGRVNADLVCVAAGVRPNLEWLIGSGLAMEQALVVDKRLLSSDARIYAAGDVVQTRDLVTGKTIVSALWTNAVAMGRTAGLNMAGGKLDYVGSLEVMNATEIEQLAMISVGEIDPTGNGYDVAIRRCGDSYRKLVFRDEALVGAVFLGDLVNAGVYTALVKSGRALEPSVREKARRGTLNYLDVCHR